MTRRRRDPENGRAGGGNGHSLRAGGGGAGAGAGAGNGGAGDPLLAGGVNAGAGDPLPAGGVNAGAGDPLPAGGVNAGTGDPLPAGCRHLAELEGPLHDLRAHVPRLELWGRLLADVLTGGGRLLTAGNGGSAAEAQHLAAELVGRYRDDRAPFSAIALCAESASMTAICNDYGGDDLFARQVRAHGRAGDILVLLSTSGRSRNVLAAAEAAAECGLATWALTGARGNPLAARADDSLTVESPHTATVQEIHLIAIHLLCAAVEEALTTRPAGRFTRAAVQ